MQPTVARRGKLTFFSIEQEIRPDQIPQKKTGQNHVVVGLTDLEIMAASITDPENTFIVPLPESVQFDIRNRWHARDFIDFYRHRLGESKDEER
jgi:hypothetical protein